MDFQNQPPFGPPEPSSDNGPEKPPFYKEAAPAANGMSIAAMILALTGAFSTLMLPFFLPCFLGSLSIVLALLSRGNAPRLFLQARIALTVSVCSLLVNTAILGSSLYAVFYIPEFRVEFNRAYESLYGESFDDTLKRIEFNNF